MDLAAAHRRRWHPGAPRVACRLVPLVALVALAACAEAPNEPALTDIAAKPSFSHTALHQVFTSGAHVTTWDAILPAAADPNWPTTVCTAQPQVGPNANWQNPHNAYVLTGHPWAGFYFSAPWINAWSSNTSVGPGGHNWTKYQTGVSGNGSFVIRLLADNCSWIYLDGVLVGVQPANHTASNTSYGLTLNGTHTLEFIIFDGGGAAGGKFILETTSNPPPPLDSDGDTHPNTSDAFPFDPTEWLDTDGDGVGDNGDAFPNDASESVDSDGDGVGDNADAYPNDPMRWSPDGDGDGVDDSADNCPAVSNASQADYDNDGVGDVCDSDIDGDGVANGPDAFPYDPAESADSDGDGVGDNADEFDNSNTGPVIVVGSCNTGVANEHFGNGTWANDLITAAYASAANHGAFVRTVTDLSNGWKKAGKITGREHGAIVSCAARTK